MRLWNALVSARGRASGGLALAAALLATQAPRSAHAAGINIPENGAEVAARGGTASSLLNTAYALEFNPAGLTTVDGLDVRVGGRLVEQNVSFARAGVNANGERFDKVSNGAGWNFLPSVHAAYHPPSGFMSHFAFGAGIFGPPGRVHFSYPDPGSASNPNSVSAQCAAQNPSSADDASACVAKKTPQRYSLIDANMVVVYPSIGIAFQPISMFSIGLTLQAVLPAIRFKEALGVNLLDHSEDPRNDAIVTLDVNKGVGFTGVVGARLEPLPGLAFNASFRPEVVIRASGSVNVQLPPTLASLATVSGDAGTLMLKLPPQLRVGAAYKASRFTGAAEFVYEGWSTNDQFTVNNNIAIGVAGGKPTPVGTIAIKNGWQDSFSGRLGGGYDIFTQRDNGWLLQLNAGVLYESNAIPSAEQAVPFVTGSRLGLSAGVTTGYQNFEFTASVIGFPNVAFDVTNSASARGVSTPEADASQVIYVGNGHYETNTIAVAFGVAYHGFGAAN
jgi:hypothetical protein